MISKKTKISEVLNEKQELAEKFFEAGLGCVGCPMAQMETIEQGCKAHGIDDKEIDKWIKELNK